MHTEEENLNVKLVVFQHYLKEAIFVFYIPVTQNGRTLKQTNHLQFLVRVECVHQHNEVAIKLGIISLSLLSPSCLLNLQERVIVGFPNFAWAPR